MVANGHKANGVFHEAEPTELHNLELCLGCLVVLDKRIPLGSSYIKLALHVGCTRVPGGKLCAYSLQACDQTLCLLLTALCQVCHILW